ncbi:MAG: hypothetical protein U9N76_00630, partial [Candidatus Marinimicrobia bacterium]|nr:hypothetical protein [Candidatus Neomarinimicrobiota bacterium]
MMNKNVLKILIIVLFVSITIKNANCDTFKIVQNLFSLDEIENPSFENKQIKINSNFNYLYSKYSSDSLYNRNYTHFYKFQFHSSRIKNKLQFGGFAQLEYLNFHNILNSEYTTGSINLLSQNYNLYIKTRIDEHFFKIDYKHKIIDNNFLLQVYKFPHSDTDETVNIYFYDLLEQTYGDSIRFYTKISSNVFRFYYSAPEIYSFKPFIDLQYKIIKFNIGERHINTNSPNLDGEIYTEITDTFAPLKLKIGLLSKYNNSLFVGYSNTKIKPIWQQIIFSKMYDIDTLSTGNIQSENWEIGLHKQSINSYYFFGASVGEINLQQEIKTPILGYRFILPISHQLNLDIQINHKTQILKFGRKFRNKKFNINPEINYIHSLMSIDLNYIADLEFGLTSIDSSNNYLYDINLFNLKIN